MADQAPRPEAAKVSPEQALRARLLGMCDGIITERPARMDAAFTEIAAIESGRQKEKHPKDAIAGLRSYIAGLAIEMERSLATLEGMTNELPALLKSEILARMTVAKSKCQSVRISLEAKKILEKKDDKK